MASPVGDPFAPESVDILIVMGSADAVSAIIRGDQRTQERFVQVTMAQTDRNPATITDNKGTVFETAFTYNGLTYYVGTYLEDGQSYELYIDGIKEDLMKLR